jgi:hypothetical protein
MMTLLALNDVHIGYGGIKIAKGIAVRHKSRGHAQRGCDKPIPRKMPEVAI